ncbi:MAG TPA: Na+/H+ antiporter NhaC family protein [Candidatus Aminicenantes bacterium]|nr:Na+/H+ antiporter NhaC family protein [Candidatus Aminicenantes bacterium]HRY66181.1 Na+/H+ antiporter NhaC family protein [Candidatus Aminicenantes bacterium]HRZ73095.1 Na+/H+ antiporter NhaC family protein [Candidatus Aminicenantes bacterium]
MSHELGILSLLPPLAAIALAFWKKQLVPSLILGIFLGQLVIAHGNPLAGFVAAIELALRVTRAPGNLEIIVFSLLIGGLLALIRESRGFEGFIAWAERRRLSGRGPVFGMTFLIGVSIIIENYSNILVNGSTMRPLYDRLGISRERLGYFIHTISINTVALVIFNGWGAFYMSLLQTQGVEQPLKIIGASIPMNFYCLASLALVAVVMATGLTIGPMKAAERRTAAGPAVDRAEARADGPASNTAAAPPRALTLVLPIVVLLGTVVLSLYVTGHGQISRGSGSASILYGVIAAILALAALLLSKRTFSPQAMLDILFRGVAELLPVGLLLVLALSLGDLCKTLGTGAFLAGLAREHLPTAILPAVIFALSCIISFATGTSYGTFAIMVPIGVPMALSAGLPLPLMFAACVSGGVFGDNCSPISDTSIVTGMAARIDVVAHTRTQIPYALIAASIAVGLFLVAGLTA